MARTAVKVKSAAFSYHAPKAKKVYLAGSFNNWDPKANPAKKDTGGNWVTKLNLKTGRYEYKFVVDGNWVNDPKCSACVPNALGSQNCVLEVR